MFKNPNYEDSNVLVATNIKSCNVDYFSDTPKSKPGGFKPFIRREGEDQEIQNISIPLK